MTESEAIAILECQRSLTGTLRNREQYGPEFKKRRRDTGIAIGKIFGDKSGHIREFSGIRYWPIVRSPPPSHTTLHTVYLQGLESADALLASMIDEIKQYGLSEQTPPEAPRNEYISQARLAELKTLHAADFDLQRLIRLCEEIDTSYRNECWHAVAALTRALMDHVPPIFGQTKFEEVANNYGGGRSFKGSMQHLENSSRRIADMYLHTQIRRSESLPTSTQVNFANDLDVLLGEIVRALQQ